MMTDDQMEEIRQLFNTKNEQEDRIGRRNTHIKWIWTTLIFILTTGAGWVVCGALWYAKMEHVAHAVDLIYLKVYGIPMP